MRTLLVTLFLGLASVNVAQGQALLIILFGDKLSTEKFQLGINADLVWSSLTGTGEASTRFSWAFGAYGEVRLSNRWRLQPELTIKTPAGATNLPITTPGSPFSSPSGDPTLDSIAAAGTVTRSANYITLPLMVKYVAGRFTLGAGGSVGILTGASDELVSDVERGGLNLKASNTDSLNTFDAGLIGSLSFMLKPKLQMRSLRVEAKFYYGLTNTVKDNTGDAVRNWQLFVGLDIPVGGSKSAEGVDESGS
jgi:hypothetical protein